MNPFIEFMKTPMAAPETANLRSLRLAFRSVCITTMLSVLFIQVGEGDWKRAVAVIAATSTIFSLVVGAIYYREKKAADDDFGEKVDE